MVANGEPEGVGSRTAIGIGHVRAFQAAQPESGKRCAVVLALDLALELDQCPFRGGRASRRVVRAYYANLDHSKKKLKQQVVLFRTAESATR